jgi:predicted nucleic acid-binding protein
MRHGQSVVSVNPRPFRPFRQSVSVDEVRLLIGDYATWEVITNTPESVLQALDIELRYKTSFWDALILQAAES